MEKKLIAAALTALAMTQAHAFEIEAPENWQVRWDNTLKGNVMARTEKADKEVYTPGTQPGWALADDSTLSVDRSNLGIFSTRFDLLSELDVVYKYDFGLRLSAAAWYDPMYKDSDHPRDRRGTWGQPSVEPGEYTETAEDLHYLGAEVLDAFIFGNWTIGDTSLGLRAGRHTIYWGNSLLAVGAINGFGGSMASLDFMKALAVPGSEAKELFRPTAKISTVFQLSDSITLNAFYNFEHERYRMPEAGTFFSPITGLTEDSEFATFPPVNLLTLETIDPYADIRLGYQADHKDEHDSGDWGINLQYYYEPWALETSLIYMNYVDKNLNGARAGADFTRLFPALTTGVLPDPLPGWDEGARAIGDSYWVFKNDIDLYGVSFAKEMWGVSFGLDLVYRKDAPIAVGFGPLLTQAYNVPDAFRSIVENVGFTVIEGPDGGICDRDCFFSADSDAYPGSVGDAWSVVVNGLGLLTDNGIWEGGSWILEATFSALDECEENCHLMSPEIKEDRIVTNIAGVFRPTWYQVRPGWDLTVPVTVGYTMGASDSQSPFTFGGNEGSGTASIGAELLVDQQWTVSASYAIRFGPVTAGIGGLLKDRDTLSVTVKRTF